MEEGDFPGHAACSEEIGEGLASCAYTIRLPVVQFLAVGISQAFICLILESYVFVRLYIYLRDETTEEVPLHVLSVCLGLFALGSIYGPILSFNAIRAKNIIQILGLCGYNVALMLYASVQPSQMADVVNACRQCSTNSPRSWNLVQAALIAMPCFIGFDSVIFSVVAWKLNREFAWTIYKNTSADPRLRRQYMVYHILLALSKFDIYFFLGFAVQILVIAYDRTSKLELCLNILAIPFAICTTFLTKIFTHRESCLGMLAMILLYIIATAYTVAKLIRIYDRTDPLLAAAYKPARESLTVFGGITLILLLSTIVAAACCTANFGKGLRGYLRLNRVMRITNEPYGSITSCDDIPMEHQSLQNLGDGTKVARMSID